VGLSGVVVRAAIIKLASGATIDWTPRKEHA
jgi:hypothetical protein